MCFFFIQRNYKTLSFDQNTLHHMEYLQIKSSFPSLENKIEGSLCRVKDNFIMHFNNKYVASFPEVKNRLGIFVVFRGG